MVLESRDPGALANFIAHNCDFRYHEKQEVLEERDPSQRLKHVNELLARENEVLSLQKEMEGKVRQELEQSALDSVIYIGVETLEYLRRGGRVTPAAAAIGSVLQIRPVLRIDGERLDAFAKVRGSAACQKRLLSALAASVAEYAARWDDIDVAAASSCVAGRATALCSIPLMIR